LANEESIEAIIRKRTLDGWSAKTFEIRGVLMAYGSFSVTVSFLRSADKRYCGERMVEPGRKWEGREGTGSAMTSQVTHGARRVVLMIDVRPGMYPHCIFVSIQWASRSPGRRGMRPSLCKSVAHAGVLDPMKIPPMPPSRPNYRNRSA